MTITTDKKNDSPEEGEKREVEPTPRNTDWIMTGLNHLRDDIKELQKGNTDIVKKLERIDERTENMRGINTRLWIVVGATSVLIPLVIWLVVLAVRPTSVPEINITPDIHVNIPPNEMPTESDKVN
ncbi:MAG: hypothetical protein F4147_02825 [Gammaproteobacteria bacterium]|nr:hypothetical protein [Gammaproteobacteria bacterium]